MSSCTLDNEFWRLQIAKQKQYLFSRYHSKLVQIFCCSISPPFPSEAANNPTNHENDLDKVTSPHSQRTTTNQTLPPSHETGLKDDDLQQDITLRVNKTIDDSGEDDELEIHDKKNSLHANIGEKNGDSDHGKKNNALSSENQIASRQYIVAGTSTGKLVIFENITEAMQCKPLQKVLSFHAHKIGPIYCMEWANIPDPQDESRNKVLLFTGSNGSIIGWDWQCIENEYIRNKATLSNRLSKMMHSKDDSKLMNRESFFFSYQHQFKNTINSLMGQGDRTHEQQTSSQYPKFSLDGISSSMILNFNTTGSSFVSSPSSLSFEVNALCFSQKDQLLYSASGDEKISIWDPISEKLINRIDVKADIEKLQQQGITLSSDQNNSLPQDGISILSLKVAKIGWLLCGLSNGSIHIYSTSTLELLYILYPFSGQKLIFSEGKLSKNCNLFDADPSSSDVFMGEQNQDQGSTNQSIDQANSHTNESISQKNSWISTIAIDEGEKWMVAGGGSFTFLSLYYLPDLELTSILPTSSTINFACFTQDNRILTAGNEKYVYVWEKNGELVKKLQTDMHSIFSISKTCNDKVYVVSGIGSSTYHIQKVDLL